MAGQVLLGYQIHAIAQRSHQRHVSRRINAADRFDRQRARDVMNRRPRKHRKAAVDLPDQLIDLLLEPPIGFDIPARRSSKQIVGYVAGPFGIFLEQPLEGSQALRQALRVIEPVDGDDDLVGLAVLAEQRRLGQRELGQLLVHVMAPPGAALSRSFLSGRAFRAQRGVVAAPRPLAALLFDAAAHGPSQARTGRAAIEVVVDADRERVDGRCVALIHGDAPGLIHLDIQQLLHAGFEVLYKVHGMEAQQVRAKHASEDVAALGQRAEYLRAGEGHMQEPADGDVAEALAQHVGQQHQVIVLHPHRVALVNQGGEGVGEELIDLAVSLPGIGVEHGFVREIVQQRP